MKSLVYSFLFYRATKNDRTTKGLAKVGRDSLGVPSSFFLAFWLG